MDYTKLASPERIKKTIENLKANGIEAFFVQTGQEAKDRVLELIPEGAEVMNMTSVTVDTIGLGQEILNSGRFEAVRNRLAKLDHTRDRQEMKKLGATPEYTVGSAHAVTEDGQVIIASNTGSQLPAYAYGAGKVIWVVGARKIVKDLEEGMKRIYDYVLPLEAERARKAYGVSGSFVSKLLIINKEVEPGRMILILVNEVLGF